MCPQISDLDPLGINPIALTRRSSQSGWLKLIPSLPTFHKDYFHTTLVHATISSYRPDQSWIPHVDVFRSYLEVTAEILTGRGLESELESELARRPIGAAEAADLQARLRVC